MTTRTVVLELGFCVGLSGNRRWLGGNSPENRSSMLDGFQALAQKIGISVPELDIIGGCGSGLKPDCLADHEGHSLGPVRLHNALQHRFSAVRESAMTALLKIAADPKGASRAVTALVAILQVTKETCVNVLRKL